MKKLLLILVLPLLMAATYTCNTSQQANGGFFMQCDVTGTQAPPPPPPPVADSLGNPNANFPISAVGGQTLTYALPKSMSGAGQLEIGQWTNTPTEMDVEVTYSPTPGDTNYWQQAPFVSSRGGTAYPCRVSGGASQGLSFRWSSQASIDHCRVDPNVGGYVTIRFGPQCGAGCNVVSKYNPQ